jgi:hypothetical protein
MPHRSGFRISTIVLGLTAADARAWDGRFDRPGNAMEGKEP